MTPAYRGGDFISGQDIEEDRRADALAAFLRAAMEDAERFQIEISNGTNSVHQYNSRTERPRELSRSEGNGGVVPRRRQRLYSHSLSDSRHVTSGYRSNGHRSAVVFEDSAATRKALRDLVPPPTAALSDQAVKDSLPILCMHRSDHYRSHHDQQCSNGHARYCLRCFSSCPHCESDSGSRFKPHIAWDPL